MSVPHELAKNYEFALKGQNPTFGRPGTKEQNRVLRTTYKSDRNEAPSGVPDRQVGAPPAGRTKFTKTPPKVNFRSFFTFLRVVRVDECFASKLQIHHGLKQTQCKQKRLINS